MQKHDYNDYDKHDHDDYDKHDHADYDNYDKHDHDDYDKHDHANHDREHNYVIHIPFHATSKGIYSFHMVQSLNPTNIQEWIGK